MDEELKRNLTATYTWMRGPFMLLFLVIYGLAEGIWFLIALFQFIHTLFTGKPSDPLLDFSENLCAYIYEILLYVSYSSDERPFPFSPWPNERTSYAAERVSPVEEEPVEPAEGTEVRDDVQPGKEDPWDGSGKQDDEQTDKEDLPSERSGKQDES